MKRLLYITAILAALFSSITSASAADNHYPEVMFILDSSGSMSEDVGGKQKLAAAKEVMHTIVPMLDENILTGLTAYGHRRPGDCSDIEVLIPAGSRDRAELLSQVDQLQPKGKTPISAAILSVASMIKMKDAETTIVLVSDGIETCGGDPCKVVQQLKSAGSKFVMHVVGFDVDPAAAMQLQCTAEAGGGKYFAAADADQLLAAMKEVTAEVQEKVQQVDPAKIADALTKTGLGKLRVTMPLGSEVSLAELKIEQPESNDVTRTVAEPKADATYPLVSGEYRVALSFATPSYGQPTRTELGIVRIVAKETRELKLGSISFNVPKSIEEGIAVEEVLIADAGTNKIVVTVRKNGNTYFHFKPKPIVAGVYNVLFRYSINKSGEPSLAAANVVVQPGKDTVVTLDSGFQLKEGDDVLGWELVPTEDQLVDANEDGAQQVPGKPRLSIRYTGLGSQNRLWYPHVVPPGNYKLNVYLDGMKEPLPAGEGIQIKPGKLVKFDAGI